MPDTVLIVDDDPDFVARIGALVSASGLEAITCEDGEAAVRVLERNEPEIDVAVIDLHLPKVNGFELIADLHRNGRPTRIIATSGVFKPIYVEQTLGLGADAVMMKTASDDEWFETIRRLLETGKDHPKRRRDAE